MFDFKGKINKDTNIYEFPTLYKEADNGRLRQWTIYVRLVKSGAKRNKTHNWNLLEDDEIIIKEEYFNDLPAGIISQLWTESGFIGGAITRSAPTYPKEKNVGKKNMRNYFHQALFDANSKYVKKIEDGAAAEKHKSAGGDNKLFFPMLARKYEDCAGKIEYPIFTQRKINGDRCIAFLVATASTSATYKNVMLYTRQKKEYPYNETNDAIRRAILPALLKFYDFGAGESIYIDGELYSHGVSLQTINSIVRGTKNNHVKINYWIYDMFYPSYIDEPFSERYQLLKDFYNFTDNNVITLTPAKLISCEKEGDIEFKKMLDDDFEGIMYRKCAGIYAKNSSKKTTAARSFDLIKRKFVYDNEYEICGYTEGGRGTSAGLIVWICRTKDNKEFKITPLGSNKERRAIFKECCEGKFVEKYKNRMLKVEFRDLSDDNIPQHAKGVMIRDYL